MDVRFYASCGVDDIFGCDGEIGWQRLRWDVDVASPDDSDGCRDARDGAGQQVPLLGFGGHCCRQVELRGDGVRGGCRDLARV